MGALCEEGIAADDKAPDFEVELVFDPPLGRDSMLDEVLADLPTACLLATPPVLLLLSEIPEVAAVLAGAPIVATLGRALGGLEAGFASAALDTATLATEGSFGVTWGLCLLPTPLLLVEIGGLILLVVRGIRSTPFLAVTGGAFAVVLELFELAAVTPGALSVFPSVL